MNIQKDTLFLMLVFIAYIGLDVYNANKTHKRLESCIEQSDSMSVKCLYRTANMSARVDSLKAQNKALAETVIYLDSCTQSKTYKTERAERRGRFLGGLIKGLFPKL
jgi:hypothetical protein